MATATTVKCACPKCECMVDLSKAIMRDRQAYCSEACASGHADGSTSCGCGGCNCGVVAE